VVQVERARLDMLGGFLGRFYRGRIELALAARVRKFLAATRGRLDADAWKLDGHSPAPFIQKTRLIEDR
jgi:hypothetical protein